MVLNGKMGEGTLEGCDFFERVHMYMYALQPFSYFSSMCVAERSLFFRMGLSFVYLST